MATATRGRHPRCASTPARRGPTCTSRRGVALEDALLDAAEAGAGGHAGGGRAAPGWTTGRSSRARALLAATSVGPVGGHVGVDDRALGVDRDRQTRSVRGAPSRWGATGRPAPMRGFILPVGDPVNAVELGGVGVEQLAVALRRGMLVVRLAWARTYAATPVQPARREVGHRDRLRLLRRLCLLALVPPSAPARSRAAPSRPPRCPCRAGLPSRASAVAEPVRAVKKSCGSGLPTIAAVRPEPPPRREDRAGAGPEAVGHRVGGVARRGQEVGSAAGRQRGICRSS